MTYTPHGNRSNFLLLLADSGIFLVYSCLFLKYPNFGHLYIVFLFHLRSPLSKSTLSALRSTHTYKSRPLHPSQYHSFERSFKPSCRLASNPKPPPSDLCEFPSNPWPGPAPLQTPNPTSLQTPHKVPEIWTPYRIIIGPRNQKSQLQSLPCLPIGPRKNFAQNQSIVGK